MFKKGILWILLVLATLVTGDSFALFQTKLGKETTPKATLNKTMGKNLKKIIPKKTSSKKGVRKKTKHKIKHPRIAKYTKVKKVDTVRQNTLQIIALNKEKERKNDSIHLAIIQHQTQKKMNPEAKPEEGYFASLFKDQKKSGSTQTLDGIASVFKSRSGWQDKKFYILTNEIPIGTIVKITTSDLKTICAKVMNALPDVSNSIQYRLSDAAAAILGMTNKTFQITVTY